MVDLKILSMQGIKIYWWWDDQEAERPDFFKAQSYANALILCCNRSKRINLLGTEKIIKTWKGGNSHVKYEKNRTNSPL